MAVAASRVTVGGLSSRIVGPFKETVTDVTFDSSYPTGGESLTPTNLGLNKVVDADVSLKTVASGVSNAYYDIANQKLIVFAADAEVADTTDIADCVARVRARGH